MIYNSFIPFKQKNTAFRILSLQKAAFFLISFPRRGIRQQVHCHIRSVEGAGDGTFHWCVDIDDRERGHIRQLFPVERLPAGDERERRQRLKIRDVRRRVKRAARERKARDDLFTVEALEEASAQVAVREAHIRQGVHAQHGLHLRRRAVGERHRGQLCQRLERRKIRHVRAAEVQKPQVEALAYIAQLRHRARRRAQLPQLCLPPHALKRRHAAAADVKILQIERGQRGKGAEALPVYVQRFQPGEVLQIAQIAYLRPLRDYFVRALRRDLIAEVEVRAHNAQLRQRREVGDVYVPLGDAGILARDVLERLA